MIRCMKLSQYRALVQQKAKSDIAAKKPTRKPTLAEMERTRRDEEIRRRYAAGEDENALSDKFGLALSQICMILVAAGRPLR